jgi:hypothetical protein
MIKLKGFFVFVYFVLAFYLLNSALSFISMPEFILNVDKWIVAVSGLFLVIGGIKFLRMRRDRVF